MPPSSNQQQPNQQGIPPVQTGGFAAPAQQNAPVNSPKIDQSTPGMLKDPNSAGANNQPPTKNRPSTQNSLLISEIRENMVIMHDGSYRAVIACKSINFDLMSARERESIEYSYQNFINALYFPVQIFVRSQRVDIGPYLDRLDSIRSAQENMLLNVLTDDYIRFIDQLAEEANIMDKSFFVAIPYYPVGDMASLGEKGKSFFSSFKPRSTTSAGATTKISKEGYEKAKDEIKNRVDSIMSGLYQMGIKCVQLNTKELGELYYNMYNPDTAVREPLGDFERITSTYVRKADGPTGRRDNIPGGM